MLLVTQGPDGLHITWQGILAVCVGITVIGAALTVLWKTMGKPLALMFGRTNEFLDDWFGVPERDGVAGRKGVMHRLNSIEVSKVDRDELADLVAAIADKADRSEVQALRKAIDQHLAAVEDVAG